MSFILWLDRKNVEETIKDEVNTERQHFKQWLADWEAKAKAKL